MLEEDELLELDEELELLVEEELLLELLLDEELLDEGKLEDPEPPQLAIMSNDRLMARVRQVLGCLIRLMVGSFV